MKAPKIHVVPSPPTEIAPARIETDLSCSCSYNLRGLTFGGRCPECGRSVSDTIRALEPPAVLSADTDRIGVGIDFIIIAHALWMFGLVPWDGWQPGELALPLLAGAAGPNVALGGALLYHMRRPPPVGMLVALALAAQVVGVWILTLAPWSRVTRWRRLSTSLLRYVLTFIPVLSAIIALSDRQIMWEFILVSHLVQMGLGVAWGACLVQLGRTFRVPRAEWLGKAAAIVLPAGNAAMLLAVTFGVTPLPRQWLAMIVAALGIGGILQFAGFAVMANARRGWRTAPARFG